MYKKYMELIFELFRYNIVRTNTQYGTNQEYIQGQLNEARHQLEILEKKLHGGNRYEF